MTCTNDPRRYLPLESFPLSAFPRTTHNIAWSPDAELALACDDCVFLFIPEFSSTPPTPFPNPNPASNSTSTSGPLRQYDEAALRFPVNPVKGPALNRHLFSSHSRYSKSNDDDDDGEFHLAAAAAGAGAGSGTVTSQGSSMNHVVALGWSACGLGRAERAVLGVLTSAGTLTVYCEGARDDAGAFKLWGRNSRALRSWVAAWGVGGGLVIPGGRGGAEHVTAFAWARDLGRGDRGNDGKGEGEGVRRALLAYENDDEEVVVVLVQVNRRGAGVGRSGGWQVEEVARFDAGGPHLECDPTDPDYSPSGSSFSLSWSPWLAEDNSKTSILSYTARGYVGFRQITIEDPDDTKTSSPIVQVADVDASGVCLYLAPDAFVVWEDMIWTIDDSKVCRGIIATPARVQAFQLPFDATSSNTIHTADECGSTYPLADDALQAENPITGLVIHPPSSLHAPQPVPSYSLVRLSATSQNRGWHQTNLPPSPLPPTPNPIDDPSPRWVTEIRQTIERQLPRALAYRRMLSAGDSISSAPSTSSSSDYDDSELDDDDSLMAKDGGDEEEEEGGNDENMGPLLGVRTLDTADQVHTTRVRIWGMAGSPGGGTTAVFVSEHSTVKPERDTYAGLNCRVLFGRVPGRGDNSIGISEPETETEIEKEREREKMLSTEARMWEWIYGGGPPVPGISAAGTDHGGEEGDEADQVALRDHFALVRQQQVCAFCETRLEPSEDAKSSRCGRGHVFENCVATQVPILAPGTSNTCGVCGSKCLKPSELVVLAPQLWRIVEDEISADLCGGCGGKFIN
ncbi:hypothetical protein F4810DRAFT_714134 [Camillea tinctor]|nr:hypothetical protein F4810DRAFT_714134 [Camillea tinctor]